ncbi:hypothetical protein PI124_g10085 [Phytophthora idaei]|nr:hypothetical protein PI124_g10085 [Phytophthora idaei]
MTLAEVAWPAGIEPLTACVATGIVFPDLGAYDKCGCWGDCFMDGCNNIGAGVFCTPNCCTLDAHCSNALRSRDTLKLFDTGRVGLGVYMTVEMDVGEIVGEYTGELSEFEGIVTGQPDQAMKRNSGHTRLYNAKSVS